MSQIWSGVIDISERFLKRFKNLECRIKIHPIWVIPLYNGFQCLSPLYIVEDKVPLLGVKVVYANNVVVFQILLYASFALKLLLVTLIFLDKILANALNCPQLSVFILDEIDLSKSPLAEWLDHPVLP